MTEILPPRAARIVGPALVVAGMGCAAAGLASVDVRQLVSSGVFGALFPLLVGAMLAAGGRMLWSPRGGLWAAPGRVRLGGDGTHDAIEAEVTAIVVHEHVETWDEQEHATWVCEAATPGGLRLLLAESEDEHGLKHVAHEIGAATGLGEPLEQAPVSSRVEGGPPPAAVAVRDRGLSVHVGAGGRLALSLLAGGLAMMPVGVVLFLDIENNSVLGFLFGPLLTLLGLALLLVPAFKAGLVETVVRDGDRLRHGYRACGVGVGHGEVALAPGAYVRVRQRGLPGACLEVVSGGRVHHLAGGVHARTALDPAGLLWLGGHVSRWLQTGDQQAS